MHGERIEMKTAGIIAEYNPYHRGHKYHLQKTLELTDADCIVSVMSGNYTQRGEISPWDKWQRSKSATIAGVDLVVELPFVYAVNSGKQFAKGAVDIMVGMGVDYISFGTELGDIDKLNELATEIQSHEDDIEEVQKEIMKDGNSFASSRAQAVSQVVGRDVSDILGSPNNLLALEYIKRINYWKAKGVEIEAVTVKRQGSGYFEVNDEAGYAGASQIRDALACGDVDVVSYFVPEEVQDMLQSAIYLGSAESKLLDIIHVETLIMSPEEISQIYCMGEGLENKIIKETTNAFSLQCLVERLTSKRYTASSMRRLLLYLMMNLKGRELPDGIYARVLAADSVGREFIKEIKNMDNGIPVITNINKEMPEDKNIQETLAIDVKAIDMYNFLTGRDRYEYSDKVRTPFML